MKRNGPDEVDVIFALLLFLVLCVTTGCARQSEVKTETTAQAVSDVRQEQGPETITTTVEEWKTPPDDPLTAPGTGLSGSPEASPTVAALTGKTSRPTLPPSARLVKRTVTVDQRGPVVTEAHTVAGTATQGDVKTDSHPELPRVRCGFGGTLWAVVALLVLAGAGYAVWKLKLL